ncbi:MAG: FCD domain-containing protein [Streptosporangiales bacterium]|nr:FCD domain-containing protein [Streptosporangiales bacterium]
MPRKKRRNLSTDARFSDVVNQLAGGYRTIGEMVYSVLKESILGGAFAPGEWLGQESLATAIGVSRIPVRTALLQLEAEGLVTFHPHKGAKVRTLTAAQIDEIFRLRTLLETYAVRLAMPRITPERLVLLRELAEQLDEEPEGREFLDARIRFYRELYDAEHNPRLVELIEELRSSIGRYLLSFRLLSDHKHVHSDLLDYVASGDLTKAEAWIYSHLEGVRKGMEAIALDEDEAPVGDAEASAGDKMNSPEETSGEAG